MWDWMNSGKHLCVDQRLNSCSRDVIQPYSQDLFNAVLQELVPGPVWGAAGAPDSELSQGLEGDASLFIFGNKLI